MTPELNHEHIQAQIAHLMAQTAKVNKEIKWYEVGVIAAITLAIAAIAKVVL